MNKAFLSPERCQQKYLRPYIAPLLGITLVVLLLAACDTSSLLNQQSTPGSTTFTGSHQQITYGTGANDVVIRTLYGGGTKGTLNLSPQISVYGDGTYILGVKQEGKLDADTLQQLLNTLADTDGLINFTTQQFADIPDQDATFLELHINGKQLEFMYGTVVTQIANNQQRAEYQLLGKALATLSSTLKGPFSTYKATAFALLARQSFSPDLQQSIPGWPLEDFTLAQAAAYECDLVPPDENTSNLDTACLKFTIPAHAILLTMSQTQTIQAVLSGKQQGVLSENGLYYDVNLRPLLPDELHTNIIAMFGSQQFRFISVPLLTGAVPPVPAPTPSK